MKGEREIPPSSDDAFDSGHICSRGLTKLPHGTGQRQLYQCGCEGGRRVALACSLVTKSFRPCPPMALVVVVWVPGSTEVPVLFSLCGSHGVAPEGNGEQPAGQE